MTYPEVTYEALREAAFKKRRKTHGISWKASTRCRRSADIQSSTAPKRERNDERESVGQVIARPAIELHPFAVLSGDDPKPVVLDFMQPSLARRRLRTFDGDARRNEPSRQDTRT